MIFAASHSLGIYVKKSLSRLVDNRLKTLTRKVHALHYANELLVCVRLSSQKLLPTRSTCRNLTFLCLGISIIT